MAILGSGTLISNTTTTSVTVGTAGEYFVRASGTFSSGTLTTEVSDGTTFTSAGTNGQLTAAGWVRVFVPKNGAIQLTLSDAGSPNISWSISE